MSGECQREMSLQEWVERLPEIHCAHKEYAALKSKVEKFTSPPTAIMRRLCEFTNSGAIAVILCIDYRKNEYIDSLWYEFPILTRDHFYHVGGKETNRNPMVEALITNYQAEPVEYEQEHIEQLTLFEKMAEYKTEAVV